MSSQRQILIEFQVDAAFMRLVEALLQTKEPKEPEVEPDTRGQFNQSTFFCAHGC